ncbi:hypothetical protein K437DRAFT_252905 [Tilletiaria anomala UBC 951]|uniref:Mis12-domain-containing protein n=1 Tax=Tilletiaria anomala (strain ATCC 24038 / CBS 436.72 / UBC 951) TaxID=1037660 RepID=A0A066WRB1_TILAU|nr:uncharacterized protein K437DRAFT_252905 [Tilletiaria anomala UBC 951]KDN53544.1 hypothetical protein K437DRAFT_252905 [Tilletiaria anomala UBC 951]
MSSAFQAQDAPSIDAHIELLTEHFGFNPKGFIDKLVYAANEHLYFLAEHFEKSLIQAMEGTVAARNETQAEQEPEYVIAAEKSTHKVLTLFENALDHMYDTVELWTLVNVFGVTSRQAQHITLTHHRGLDLRNDNGVTSAIVQDKVLSRKEQRLRAKIAAARQTADILDRAIATTSAQHARAAALEDHFDFVLQSKSGTTILASLQADSLKKVRADASAVCKDVSGLRELDPLSKSLAPPRSAKDDEEGAEQGFDGSNRDAYLYWEVNRALEEQRKAGGDHKVEAAAVSEKPGSTGRKSKGSGKRVQDMQSEGGSQGAKRRNVGKTAELEVSLTTKMS